MFLQALSVDASYHQASNFHILHDHWEQGLSHENNISITLALDPALTKVSYADSNPLYCYSLFLEYDTADTYGCICLPCIFVCTSSPFLFLMTCDLCRFKS